MAGVGVTAGTRGDGMEADKSEGGLGMVETAAIGIHPIMTGNTIQPESKNVLLRKGQVHLKVTVGADGLVERKSVIQNMAIAAGEKFAIQPQTMGFKRKPKLVVWIPTGRHLGERRIGAVMFGVAGAAIEIRLGETHQTVQALRVLQFGAHVNVTCQAAIRHAFPVPRGGMTSAAFLNGGMRGDPAQDSAALCAQISGRKELTAARVCNTADAGNGQNGGDDGRCGRKKSKRSPSHLVLVFHPLRLSK